MHQTGIKGIQVQLCAKGGPVKIVWLDKWYMHKILENKTHKILWDIEIQTDLLTASNLLIF